MYLGLPAPLFTIDLDTEMGRGIARHAFQRFFDCLEPAFGLQVTLGQVNTVVRLSGADEPFGTVRRRVARGRHFAHHDPHRGGRRGSAHAARAPDAAAELALEPECPGFSRHFGQPHEIDALYESIYVDVHRRYAASRPRMQQMLSS